MIKRLFFSLITLCLLAVCAAAAGWVLAEQRFTTASTSDTATRIEVPRGAGLRHISQILAQQGLLKDKIDLWVFQGMVKARGTAASLQAGEFDIPAGSTMADISAILSSGRNRVHYTLTVPEGLTSPEVLALVNKMDVLSGAAPAQVATGSLLPETYAFLRGDSRAEAVSRMQAAMTKTLDELWDNRDPNLPLTSKEEAVILASVVEKETGLAAERPQVAAVFINRLRLGMPLQSDPTVIYGLAPDTGSLGRALLRKDLEQDHPWNTYTRPGLPQSAIANPGRESIAAVLHPAQTKALYFVADGTGGHAFAESLAEHNRNVARWRRLQRQ
jgi:UPF0755 protein